MRFTYTDYIELLAQLRKAGYCSIAFEEAESRLERGEYFLLLRHDIDFDLHAALAMAHIEADMGITSTWFPLLRTESYNLFSAEGSRLMGEILGMGHRLGLQFDCTLYPGASVEELNQATHTEARMLENWFGQTIKIVSFHRPRPDLVGSSQTLTAPRLHTYQQLFIKRIHYLADSRGVWRYGEPLASQAFRERRPLYLLVHPIWWRDQEVPPEQTLHDFIRRRNLELEESVAANSSVYRGRLYERQQ